MSSFLIPKGVYDIMEKMICNFWWGSTTDTQKIHWIKWDRICKPKENGGLEIRDLRIFNIALLRKWWWRIRNEKESLWYKVLERKLNMVIG
jgi:hypothetical protein